MSDDNIAPADDGRKGKPIIFSAPMVRALLAGLKTQTRRLLNPQPYDFPHPQDGTRCWNAAGAPGGRICLTDRGLLNLHHKPHPGDRLYVRENWRVSPEACEGWHPEEMRGWIDYQAGGSLEVVAPSFEAVEKAAFLKGEDRDWDFIPSRYRPCIHMPRWASRLTLTVTEVRVERLRSISERDARAEGLEQVCVGGLLPAYRGTPDLEPRLYPDSAYGDLWDSLHTAPGTRWADDPWVVAVSFDVAHGNIDGGQHG